MAPCGLPTLRGVIRAELRTLWAAPPPPDPPLRVWRDWLVLAVGLGCTTLEGVLRPDVAWRPVAVLLAVVVSVATLWRRTHPLAAVVAAIGSAVVVQLATFVVAPPEPLGLYTATLVVVLVYALARWGSGRQIVLGAATVVAVLVVSALTDDAPRSEYVFGTLFISFPGMLGASVRFWSGSRRRELDQVRSREREQLARELHDTVAHHVSAIVIRAQAGRVVSATDPGAAVEALEGIEEEGARTLEAMRAMVGALRHGDARAELAPRAGVADLERLVRAPGGGLQVDLRLDGELSGLPPTVDAAVYRIVQESLTNAMRHAIGATQVLVRVSGGPGQVRITVRDDGVPPGRGRDGYGLTGLRERAALLGGSIEAGPGADRGWLVEAQMPRDGVGGRVDPRARR